MMCGCWMLDAGEDRLAWVCVGACICVSATLPYENLLHHHLQLAMRRSKFRRCSADEMTMMTMLWSSDQQHPAIAIQPSNQPTDQPTKRPRRPTMFPDARRGDSLSPIFVPCRGERGPKTCERKSSAQMRESPVPYRTRSISHPYTQTTVHPNIRTPVLPTAILRHP